MLAFLLYSISTRINSEKSTKQKYNGGLKLMACVVTILPWLSCKRSLRRSLTKLLTGNEYPTRRTNVILSSFRHALPPWWVKSGFLSTIVEKCTATTERDSFFLYIWADFGLTAYRKKAAPFYLQERLKKKYDLANNFQFQSRFQYSEYMVLLPH